MNSAHPDGAAYHEWAGVRSAYVKASDRYQPQTNCYTGRGQFYTGTLAITKTGNACEAGTFCRNDNPKDHLVPFCKEAETGSYKDCDIIRCDELYGKYAGNRGAAVQYSGNVFFIGLSKELLLQYYAI